jgi:DNA polymerase delta subunit 3
VAPSKPAGLAKQVQKTETTQPKVESDNESISKPSSQKSQTKSTAKAPVQRQKGDIFSSFAKSKPKLKTEDSTASAASGNESVRSEILRDFRL